MKSMLILLSVVMIAAAAPAAELELLRTIGADDEDILLHGPEAIAFAPDGSYYVLNGGESNVLHFDADWTLLKTFARRGQGPGEFERATGMILRDDALWVFEMGRATLFALDGTYIETRRSQAQMYSPIRDGDGFLCRLGGSDLAAGRLDADLELLGKLGPPCANEDFFQSYRTCGFMHMIAHPDWLCLLLNPIDGRLFAVNADGDVEREIPLTKEEGRSNAVREDDSVTMSFTLVQGRGHVDDRGLFWSLPFPVGEQDEEAPQILEVRDRDLEPLAVFTLPEDVTGFALTQAPDRSLMLLDSGASLIHVLAYPEGI